MSRKQKLKIGAALRRAVLAGMGLMAALPTMAQDASTRVFCYADCQVRKDQQNDAILEFVAYWKKRTGHVPEELIFDSRLTTYAKLNELNADGVDFITLRRRSPKLLRHALNAPFCRLTQKPLELIPATGRGPTS